MPSSGTMEDMLQTFQAMGNSETYAELPSFPIPLLMSALSIESVDDICFFCATTVLGTHVDKLKYQLNSNQLLINMLEECVGVLCTIKLTPLKLRKLSLLMAQICRTTSHQVTRFYVNCMPYEDNNQPNQWQPVRGASVLCDKYLFVDSDEWSYHHYHSLISMRDTSSLLIKLHVIHYYIEECCTSGKAKNCWRGVFPTLTNRGSQCVITGSEMQMFIRILVPISRFTKVVISDVDNVDIAMFDYCIRILCGIFSQQPAEMPCGQDLNDSILSFTSPDSVYATIFTCLAVLRRLSLRQPSIDDSITSNVWQLALYVVDALYFRSDDEIAIIGTMLSDAMMTTNGMGNFAEFEPLCNVVSVLVKCEGAGSLVNSTFVCKFLYRLTEEVCRKVAVVEPDGLFESVLEEALEHLLSAWTSLEEKVRGLPTDHPFREVFLLRLNGVVLLCIQCRISSVGYMPAGFRRLPDSVTDDEVVDVAAVPEYEQDDYKKYKTFIRLFGGLAKYNFHGTSYVLCSYLTQTLFHSTPDDDSMHWLLLLAGSAMTNDECNNPFTDVPYAFATMLSGRNLDDQNATSACFDGILAMLSKTFPLTVRDCADDSATIVDQQKGMLDSIVHNSKLSMLKEKKRLSSSRRDGSAIDELSDAMKDCALQTAREGEEDAACADSLSCLVATVICVMTSQSPLSPLTKIHSPLLMASLMRTLSTTIALTVLKTRSSDSWDDPGDSFVTSSRRCASEIVNRTLIFLINLTDGEFVGEMASLCNDEPGGRKATVLGKTYVNLLSVTLLSRCSIAHDVKQALVDRVLLPLLTLESPLADSTRSSLIRVLFDYEMSLFSSADDALISSNDQPNGVEIVHDIDYFFPLFCRVIKNIEDSCANTTNHRLLEVIKVVAALYESDDVIDYSSRFVKCRFDCCVSFFSNILLPLVEEIVTLIKSSAGTGQMLSNLDDIRTVTFLVRVLCVCCHDSLTSAIGNRANRPDLVIRYFSICFEVVSILVRHFHFETEAHQLVKSIAIVNGGGSGGADRHKRLAVVVDMICELLILGVHTMGVSDCYRSCLVRLYLQQRPRPGGFAANFDSVSAESDDICLEAALVLGHARVMPSSVGGSNDRQPNEYTFVMNEYFFDLLRLAWGCFPVWQCYGSDNVKDSSLLELHENAGRVTRIVFEFLDDFFDNNNSLFRDRPNVIQSDKSHEVSICVLHRVLAGNEPVVDWLRLSLTVCDPQLLDGHDEDVSRSIRDFINTLAIRRYRVSVDTTVLPGLPVIDALIEHMTLRLFSLLLMSGRTPPLPVLNTFYLLSKALLGAVFPTKVLNSILATCESPMAVNSLLKCAGSVIELIDEQQTAPKAQHSSMAPLSVGVLLNNVINLVQFAGQSVIEDGAGDRKAPGRDLHGKNYERELQMFFVEMNSTFKPGTISAMCMYLTQLPRT